MRVYDEHVDLDYSATHRFFETRGGLLDKVGPLSAVLYQDQKPELAQRRSTYEIERIAPYLKRDGKAKRILDLGCGTGRWTAALADVAEHYLGLDFCEDFLIEARRLASAYASETDIKYANADLSKGLPSICAGLRYDTVLMAGVLLYLNDADAARLLDEIASIVSQNGVLYIREPLGITKRLTLKEHFSSELGSNYSSVYRAASEFKSLLDDVAARHGLTTVISDSLYPQELENRSETRQYFFLLTKRET